MRQKIVFFLSVCLLASATSFAQQKKPVAKPKPRTTAGKPKPKPTTKPAPAPAEPLICYPMKEVKDYYRISLVDEQFKNDFEEIFELSRFDYAGYSLKAIIENRVRTNLGNAAVNSLDMFAAAAYLEISFNKTEYKKQVLDEICKLFADPNAFEKYLYVLKPKK
jgi:hypothetical protein